MTLPLALMLQFRAYPPLAVLITLLKETVQLPDGGGLTLIVTPAVGVPAAPETGVQVRVKVVSLVRLPV